jgi:hypothetical protein
VSLIGRGGYGHDIGEKLIKEASSLKTTRVMEKLLESSKLFFSIKWVAEDCVNNTDAMKAWMTIMSCLLL